MFIINKVGFFVASFYRMYVHLYTTDYYPIFSEGNDFLLKKIYHLCGALE